MLVSAGPLDYLWHSFFGFNGLLSPPHLILAMGVLLGSIGALMGIVSVTNCLDVSGNRIDIMNNKVEPTTISKTKMKKSYCVSVSFGLYRNNPRLDCCIRSNSYALCHFQIQNFLILTLAVFFAVCFVTLSFPFVTSFILYSSIRLGRKVWYSIYSCYNFYYNICSNCYHTIWNIGSDNSLLYHQFDSYPRCR